MLVLGVCCVCTLALAPRHFFCGGAPIRSRRRRIHLFAQYPRERMRSP